MQGSLLTDPVWLTAAVIYHGGELASVESRFGRHNWIDLSTGINPFAYSLPRSSKKFCTRLPERALIADLAAAAAEAYGLSDPACVVPGPGSQAFIHLIPRLVPPGRVLVIGHSNTVPAIVAALSGRSVPAMDETDFSTVYVVARPRYSPASTTVIHLP